MAGKRFLPDDGNSLVRREVVLVVVQHKQVEHGDEAVGGIAGGKIDFFFLESARE